ncbi:MULTISPECIES: hypothetical protein [Streptomyces]|uniref:Uncharacterized protein n=1 Tax=Streptomyces graminofaciens TaxID=68212 RepID=A0ABN5VCM6_9ACTN|nr:hypothetical protein [Streptomyces graminofaciens]BBC30735.1 hypothetical protein SGFS_020290 [Streptomyces graminofaciens]
MTRPTALPLTAASFEPSPRMIAAAALSVLAVLGGGWLVRRARARAGTARSSAPAVWVASLAAIGCTAYSADTSWRFAADYLDMDGTAERAAMFAAAELALFATALMARQNLNTQGAPGLPGILVWMITGVQVIPAYAESGPVGGTVRAFVGPVMAAMLWHQAMGIELRLRKPGAASHGILATLGREVRERLLSRLGIAERDRDAAQITRHRATAQAVALAARLAERSAQSRESRRGRRITRRLSKALARAGVGTDLKQRRALLDQLAAHRHATALATIDLPSPWTLPPQDEHHEDHGLVLPAIADGTAAGQRTGRTLAVADACTAPDGDGPETDPADLIAGTAYSATGDHPHTVPAIGDRESNRDRDMDPANGDRDKAVPGTGNIGDRAEANGAVGDKTAAQSPGGPSPTRAPNGHNAPDSGTGTDPAGDRPQSVPDGDHGDPGTGTESVGDRPHTVPNRRGPKASRNRSRGGHGKPSRRQGKVSVDQLVTQLRPHVPELLERDGNAEVTRTQLREIMRAHGIGIRNDRLTPVLERLRHETATSNAKKRSAR